MRDFLLVTRIPAGKPRLGRAGNEAAKIPARVRLAPTVLPARGPPSGCPRIRAGRPGGRHRGDSRARPEFSSFYGWRASRGGAQAGEPQVAHHGTLRRAGPPNMADPDSQVLWYPSRSARRSAGACGTVDVIVATSFPRRHPHRAHDRGAPFGRRTWRTSATPGPGRVRADRPAPLAELERRLEARMIRDAGAVVHRRRAAWWTTRSRGSCPITGRRFTSFKNGYDEDDFHRHRCRPSSRPVSIVHTGRLRRCPRPTLGAR